MANIVDSELENEIITFIKVVRNDLQSDELGRRKKALQELIIRIFPENQNFPQTLYQNAFAECHLQVMKCFRDKSEMCRELSITLMSKFIENLDLNDYYLTYIFPVLVERIGSVELIEESEELRLEMVNFLIVIIKKYAKTEFLLPFLNDTVQILCQTVVDKYPKVKESSCKCIMDLAIAMPKHFHMQCETLVKPVLKAFSHQHFRIRVIAIQAIGVIILHSSSSSIVENTVGPLAERLFDQTAAVRRTVAQVAAQLLTEYRDRYSHFHRLLPLILTGLCDEVPDTRAEAQILWAKVGDQYAKENENDLKDQLDFPVGAPEHYPPGITRPNLGCRILVQRNSTKMLGAVCVELTSWQDDIRIRCAQLLCVIVLHCEQFITQGLQDILPTMYIACQQRETQRTVLENVTRTARLIGVFVPIKTWSQLVLPAVSDSPTTGHLRVLSSMISGTPQTDLAQVASEIADLLATESVRCSSRHAQYQKELVECCKILSECPEVARQIFFVLVTVVALCADSSEESVGNLAREVIKNVQEVDGHAAEVMKQMIEGDSSLWTTVSPDRCIFDVLLLEWSANLVPHLSLVANVLQRSLDERCDPEARLKTFQALSTFLKGDTLSLAKSNGDSNNSVSEFVRQLIKEMLLPALVWHAGRTAEALRTAASFCLNLTLKHAQSNLISTDVDLDQLLTTVTALTDDGSWRTRVYGSRSLAIFDSLLCNNENWKKRWANSASVALLKRLDDPNDTVRLEAMASLKIVLNTPNLLDAGNLRYLVDCVLTHVDDHDSDGRDAALGILKAMGNGDWSYLNEKLRNDKHLFKNSDACDELLKYLNSLSV